MHYTLKKMFVARFLQNVYAFTDSARKKIFALFPLVKITLTVIYNNMKSCTY